MVLGRTMIQFQYGVRTISEKYGLRANLDYMVQVRSLEYGPIPVNHVNKLKVSAISAPNWLN